MITGYTPEYEERLRTQSLSGSSAKRTTDKVVKIKYSKFKKFLIAYTAIIAITTGAVIGVGGNMVNNIKNNITVNELAYDFRIDCINNETHRTMDNEHYYYDYDDIARYMYDSGDFDASLYLFYINTSEYQVEKLLANTEFRTLNNYLETHNFKSFDDWKKAMRERITLTDQIDDRQTELDKMNEEHNMDDKQDSTYNGGAK